MRDLLDFRNEIDEIDSQIVELFERRMRLSEEVAGYKLRSGMAVLDTRREKEKIESVTEKAHGEFNKKGMKELITQIMALSRKKQYQLMTSHGVVTDDGFDVVASIPMENIRVVFQGVEGAYSYAAMKAYFKGNFESFHVRTWKEAAEAVAGERADYAVLPIENSTAGAVEDIFDLLMSFRLFIVADQVIPIDHVLLGLPGSKITEIRKVVSHPQGLAQCREYLQEKPCWQEKTALNTAEAAKTVSEGRDKSVAAIASREAGELYGLVILDEGLCRNQANSTRFIILSRHPIHQADADRVSICFELKHTTGSLYNMLSHIIYNGLNMTRIESRPVPGKTWEYRFFVEFEGNLKESAVINALRGIREEALSMRVLGNYREYSSI